MAKITNIKKAEKENDESLRSQIADDEFQSNLMKIVVNFAQISSVLTQYKLQWPDFVRWIYLLLFTKIARSMSLEGSLVKSLRTIKMGFLLIAFLRFVTFSETLDLIIYSCH